MLRFVSFLVLSTCMLISYQNCGPGLESIIDNSSESASTVDTPQTFTSLYNGVIVPQCLSCHSGSTLNGGIDLSSYDSIMDAGIVVPGDAANSALYYEVSTGSMPPTTPLVQNSLRAFREWINNGANND